MTYQSIEELVAKLDLRADPADVNEVKTRIREEIAAIHPDKHNGDFSSAEDKERFNELLKGLDYLETRKTFETALIPVSQVTELIKAINRVQEPTREEKAEKVKDECRSLYVQETRSKYIFPRISSGVLAGFCALIFHNSDKFYSAIEVRGELNPQPLLAKFIEPSTFQFFVSVAFIIACVMFLFTWINERKEKAKEEWLLSDYGRRSILGRVVKRKRTYQAEAVTFTLKDWASEILVFDRNKPKLNHLHYAVDSSERSKSSHPFQYGITSQSLAEKIARLHINELQQYELVKKLKARRFEPTYEIEAELVDEILADS